PWIVERVESAATRYLFTMERCAQCGKFRRTEEGARVLCLCSDLLCRGCGRRAVWRPISDYYDEETCGFWHVPYFAARGWWASWEKMRDGVTGHRGSHVASIRTRHA